MHSTSRWKELLRPWVPPPLLRLRQHWRNRRRKACTQRLHAASGGRVLAGPFAGLTYVDASAGSVLGAKLLGTYESELHQPLAAILSCRHDLVVNVGAGEGYYAVGLAVRLSSASVSAFEIDPSGQTLCRQLAERNGVADRVAVTAGCTTESLRNALQFARSPLVVMDVEGVEDDLLDPVAVPELGNSVILVEVHEGLRPGVTATLLGRFTQTHRVVRIPTATFHGSLPQVNGFTNSELRLLMDEMRPEMEWFWMTPLAGGTGQ